MNLEDRLRSHMHSGEDLFVESDRDASAITSAGRRRTRRNQVGGAAAGGLLALGIVFGVASSFTGDADQEAVAQAESDLTTTDESVAEIAESAIAPANDGGGFADSIESQAAPDGFVPTYEVLTGVGDGFAGLRSSAAGIEFIESDDGESWSVSPTSGIPEGADITSITSDDGVLAAPFHVSDPSNGRHPAYVGTSTDGIAWTVSEIELDGELTDPFLPEVVLSSGEVVGVVTAWPLIEEDSAESRNVLVFTFRGPIGGPFEPTLLPTTGFGVGELASTDSVVMFNVFHDGGTRIWASGSAGDWGVVRELEFDDFASLGDGDSQIIVAGATAVESSVDAGTTWSSEDLPVPLAADNSSSVLVSGAETAAILISRSSETGESDGHQLVVLIDGDWREVSLEAEVPDLAFVNLIAVSNEEALLEVFPVNDEPADDLAASGGLVETPEVAPAPPTYVRIPLR